MLAHTLLPSLAVLLVLNQHAFSLDLNDTCTNPEGESGRCTYLRECKPLLDIYRKQRVSDAESSFFHNSRCESSQPLVCCVLPTPKYILPRPNDCGFDTSDRILNGTVTRVDEFPWTALIRYETSDGSSTFNCGGSLINSRYIVTAAHCILRITPGMKVAGVRLGEHDISNDDPDCDGLDCADIPVDVGIEKIIVHEDYNVDETAQWNDIALIRFDREVAITDFISPICIPIADGVRSRNLVGHKAIATGWGRTESGDPSPVKLKVALDVVSSDSCTKTYARAGAVLRDTQFCAGGKKDVDTCSGDSGGPLMYRVSTNYYLYGIVSFGPTKCGIKNVPGVYTYVPKFIQWIESHLE